MSDVEVPFGENPGETATLLLAAAEDLDLPVDSVRTSEGVFIVPEEVADEAGVNPNAKSGDKAPAKKAAAKKTAAKKE